MQEVGTKSLYRGVYGKGWARQASRLRTGSFSPFQWSRAVCVGPAGN